jgi:hypothetical protein
MQNAIGSTEKWSTLISLKLVLDETDRGIAIVVRNFWAGKGRPAGPPSATAAKHGTAIITFEYFEGAFRNFVTDGAALHRSHTDLLHKLRASAICPSAHGFA